MSAGPRAKPPFRADHVGSLLRPAELRDARQAWRDGKLSAEALREVEDRCIRDVVAKQEGVGLKSVTDGDFRREHWLTDFLFAINGFELTGDEHVVPFSGGVTYRGKISKVTGKLTCPDGGIGVADFEFLKAATRKTAKVMIPAPDMVCSSLDVSRVDPTVYPDVDEMWDDLGKAYGKAVTAFADAGCTYLQIDDVNGATVSDENRNRLWRARGYEIEGLIDLFLRLNNAAIGGRPPGMTATVHMCRGNFQSEWTAEGTYDLVADKYFNQLQVDAFFLEYDDARSGGFGPLRYMPKDKIVVLGLMTSKRPELEDKDEFKRRIEEAAKYVPIENICISPQCGFASTEEGNRLTEDEQWRKLAHLVEIAEEVWGGI